MKKSALFILLATLVFGFSCSKDSDEPVSNSQTETFNSVQITAVRTTIELGDSFVFRVKNNLDVDVTSNCSFYANEQQTLSVFTPTEAGIYNVKAIYSRDGVTFESNTINVTVTHASTTFKLYDEIVFYDGYAATVSNPVPSGVIRISNASYVTKLSSANLDMISDDLDIKVTIGALCDNYDRIGGVFLNLVNKNQNFDQNTVAKRIEIGRFITPFMNKNFNPDEVPYLFEADNIASILKDADMNLNYDFWIEFNVFGVPYAAQTQVSGCSGRIDVFRGTLEFMSTTEDYTPVPQFLSDVATYHIVNNYQAAATDVLGQTTKTFNFNASSSVSNASLYVITSNHGANDGGEEYNRRQHYIYLDNTLIGTYIPGGKSCEPYRFYNTQPNGIYGSSPRPLSVWLSFNNWCPGDVIPIRKYYIDNLTQGSHSFRIEVPDAEFVNSEGYFPVSVYLQGDVNQ